MVTTLVNTATQVITATEFSTETIVITPSVQAPEAAPVNPLASLLPALLQANPLLSAQLNLNPTPTQVLPIVSTEAPEIIQQQPGDLSGGDSGRNRRNPAEYRSSCSGHQCHHTLLVRKASG